MSSELEIISPSMPTSYGVSRIPSGIALSDSEVVAIATRMAEELVLCDRNYHLVTYENCFTGKDAVDWMLRSSIVQSQEAAEALGNLMLSAGLVHHVLNEHVFKNKHLFYR